MGGASESRPPSAPPNLVAAMWRHTNLNTKPWAKVPVNEDDRAEIGKGHEFPTQLFKSHYNMPTFEISKYASSEILAWAMAFSLGNVVLSGTGPYVYVITPALGATNPTGSSYRISRSCSRSGLVARLCWTKCWWAARSKDGSSPSRIRRPRQCDVLGGMRDDRHVHVAQRDHVASRRYAA